MSEWKTESERIAHMRGIYIGWERGLLSASAGTGAGNVLQTVVRDACQVLHRDNVLTMEQALLVRGQCETLLKSALATMRPMSGVLTADGRVGSAHHLSKLTEEDVVEMRALFARGGVTKKQLGRRYKVDQSAIAQIVHGVSWKHVGGPITPKSRTRRNMTEMDRAKIVRLRRGGKTCSAIALEVGCSRSTASRVWVEYLKETGEDHPEKGDDHEVEDQGPGESDEKNGPVIVGAHHQSPTSLA